MTATDVGRGRSARTDVREVVGLFTSSALLEAAVTQLGAAGIHRAAMSVLGVTEQHKDGAGAEHRSARGASADPSAMLTAFASRLSPSQAQGISVAVPMEIGGFGAAWAVAAAGGTLMTAVGATMVGGVVGAGLTPGRSILSVRVGDPATEALVSAVLRNGGAGSVHTYRTDRPSEDPDALLHGRQSG